MSDGDTPAAENGHKHRQFSSIKDLVDSRLRVFDPELVESSASCGRMEGVKRDEHGNLVIWGWAVNPERQAPARSVVVLMNSQQIPIAIPVCRARPDVADHFDNPRLSSCGWYVCVPSHRVEGDECAFEAFALMSNGNFGVLEPIVIEV